jgi:hypothetical protein
LPGKVLRQRDQHPIARATGLLPLADLDVQVGDTPIVEAVSRVDVVDVPTTPLGLDDPVRVAVYRGRVDAL